MHPFRNVLAVLSPPTLYNSEKFSIHASNIVCGVREGAGPVNWKTPQKCNSVSKLLSMIVVKTNVKPGRFYILLKLHKTENPGRPIVSSNIHPPERISQFVDYHINPLVSTLDSHIKDTTDFLNKLSNLGNLPNDAILVTLDVSSLYTNISHNQGIDECCHFLTHPHRDTK